MAASTGRAAASTASDLDRSAPPTLGSQAAVPPRQQPPRNPDLLRAGMVVTGLGIFAAVAGMLTLQRAGEDTSGNAARLGGGILAGGGVVFAIGVRFWIIGAAPDAAGTPAQ